MADLNREIHDVADRAEAELQKLITYLNDEVVPDVRRHSSSALRTAAERLHELAQHLDKGRKDRP
jgi:hypothetical protein